MNIYRKRLGIGSTAALAACFSGNPAGRAQTNTEAPTVEETTKFSNDAEQRLLELGIKAGRASWVAENFITDDTEQISADANEILNTASTQYAKQAHRYDKLALPAGLARKRLLLELATGFPAPNDAKAQKEL